MSLVIDISVSRVDYLLTVQARRTEDRTPGRDIYKAGVHPCGCWRDEDQIHVCADCNKVWPCATAEAIETALAGGCRECHQTDGHHKLDCGRRTT